MVYSSWLVHFCLYFCVKRCCHVASSIEASLKGHDSSQSVAVYAVMLLLLFFCFVIFFSGLVCSSCDSLGRLARAVWKWRAEQTKSWQIKLRPRRLRAGPPTSSRYESLRDEEGVGYKWKISGKAHSSLMTMVFLADHRFVYLNILESNHSLILCVKIIILGSCHFLKRFILSS